MGVGEGQEGRERVFACAVKVELSGGQAVACIKIVVGPVVRWCSWGRHVWPLREPYGSRFGVSLHWYWAAVWGPWGLGAPKEVVGCMFIKACGASGPRGRAGDREGSPHVVHAKVCVRCFAGFVFASWAWRVAVVCARGPAIVLQGG